MTIRQRICKLIFRSAVLACVAMVIAGTATQISAQQIEQRFTLSVSPSTAYVMVKPGATAVHTVTVRNRSNQAVTVKPRLVDFETDGKTGSPVLLDTTSFTYLANQDELTAITIEPDQQAKVPFVLKPPAGSPLHEYHTTILFEYQPTKTNETDSVLVPTVGTNLVVLVAGEQQNTLLKVITLQRPRVVDSFRPLDFRPVAQNQGQAAAMASGSAVIKDWRGRVVASVPIYPDVILARSARELRASRPAAPVLPDDPQAVIATQLEPTVFTYKAPMLLGAYTIDFSFIDTAQEGRTTTIQSFTIIAFPFSATLIILICVAALASVRIFQAKAQRSNHHPPSQTN